jgi:hypothetical protein
VKKIKFYKLSNMKCKKLKEMPMNKKIVAHNLMLFKLRHVSCISFVHHFFKLIIKSV